ncbi:hypothetical protein A6P54_16585 [Bacillus sp. MKU004]|nr:hypothetical protein A6P54_16585 [Bacillus sp. MKU004]
MGGAWNRGTGLSSDSRTGKRLETMDGLEVAETAIRVTIFSSPALFFKKINLFLLNNRLFSVHQQVSSQNAPLPAFDAG